MNPSHPEPIALACPLPPAEGDRILLAHGGGGRLTHALIERVFLPAFGNPALAQLHDGATLEPGLGRIAVTTDAFVVTPRFFPGGDIGSLAVHGTINDLAMCGAEPVALAVAFILEEGLPLAELQRVVRSMAEAARAVPVPIVTGDTKVVDRGKGDGIFIHTTGIGRVPEGIAIAPSRASAGDQVLINGTIADHGIAILSVREGLEFGPGLMSDSAALNELVSQVLARCGRDVHVMRDPTRGGVAGALSEIARQAAVGIRLDESALPVSDAVRGACELLGLDPLHIANEGKCLLIVAPEAAERALAALRSHPLGRGAMRIGEVVDQHPGQVVIKSSIGGTRLLDIPSGEPLPRIC